MLGMKGNILCSVSICTKLVCKVIVQNSFLILTNAVFLLGSYDVERVKTINVWYGAISLCQQKRVGNNERRFHPLRYNLRCFSFPTLKKLRMHIKMHLFRLMLTTCRSGSKLSYTPARFWESKSLRPGKSVGVCGNPVVRKFHRIWCWYSHISKFQEQPEHVDLDDLCPAAPPCPDCPPRIETGRCRSGGFALLDMVGWEILPLGNLTNPKPTNRTQGRCICFL